MANGTKKSAKARSIARHRLRTARGKATTNDRSDPGFMPNGKSARRGARLYTTECADAVSACR